MWVPEGCCTLNSRKSRPVILTRGFRANQNIRRAQRDDPVQAHELVGTSSRVILEASTLWAGLRTLSRYHAEVIGTKRHMWSAEFHALVLQYEPTGLVDP